MKLALGLQESPCRARPITDRTVEPAGRDRHHCMQNTDEAHTVVHEIGHSCGSHDGHVPGSIMDNGAPRGQNSFAPASIVVFRNEIAW